MEKITIRTTYAENCYEQINLMENLFRLRSRDLDKIDVAHYSAYIFRAKELYHEGKFDEQGLLKDEDWDYTFNFRYDFESIRGTHGEMLVHMARNQCGSITRSHSCSGGKEEELAGWDGEIYKPTWNGIYFQSKLLNTEENGSLIKIYHDYIKPSYTAHRLALPDIEARMFMEMDLPVLRENVIDDPDPKLVHSTFTEQWGDKVVTVSLVRKDYILSKRKTFDFWEYHLT